MMKTIGNSQLCVNSAEAYCVLPADKLLSVIT